MFRFWENWSKKKEEKQTKENLENLLKTFKESSTYPDYPVILLFYQYFFEKLFKNYILPNYFEKTIPEKPVILELGSYKSRIAHLVPQELKERTILSDINLEILKENPEGIKINFDFRNIPLKEDSIPIIIGTNVFLHILGLGNIEEILRILKANGQAIFIEDLSMYIPALALYYQRKGNKYVYFVYHPAEAKVKCFILEREKINEFKKAIEDLIQKGIDLKKAKKEIEENFSKAALSLFNDIEKVIKTKNYLNNPFKFSIILFSLANQLNAEFLAMDDGLKQKTWEFKLGLNNFFILLNNILKKYSSKEINCWEDFLEDIKKDFKEKGLSLEYESITAETNFEEVKKWQEAILNNIDLTLLISNNPYWEYFKEYKNLIIEKLGLEIGYDGEKITYLEKNLQYKALIIKIKKEQ